MFRRVLRSIIHTLCRWPIKNTRGDTPLITTMSSSFCAGRGGGMFAYSFIIVAAPRVRRES